MTIEITYTLEIEPEHEHPRDLYCDDADVAWVLDQLARGNEWAWFCAKVTASVEINGETFSASDYLGGCSYQNRADFEACDYFADMKQAARDALVAELNDAIKRGRIARKALGRIAP